MLGAIQALGGSERISSAEGNVRVLTGEPPKGLASRMGFCHFDGTVAIECGTGVPDIADGALAVLREEAVASVGFIARSTGRLASSEVFESLERSARSLGLRVAHRHPARKMFAVAGRERSYLGWVGSECDRSSLLGRRGSRMPFSRPIVMDPRLARAMVNLTGLRAGSRILDPFMGPGGLAIEASHLGMRYTGIEIDPEIFAGAMRNIEIMGGPLRASAMLGDSRSLGRLDIGAERHFDGVVTDPPFGRSASLKGSSRGELTIGVLEEAFVMLERGAPVVLDIDDPSSLEGLSGYRAASIYSHRVHRSLTRHIIVLTRD
jgi:tRNA (guanine10-N2)-dimethyltransferase